MRLTTSEECSDLYLSWLLACLLPFPINIHLSWASRFPTEQFTSVKLIMLMSSYISQQALNALSFLAYFLKTVLSSNRCNLHFNLVRKEFCSISVLHQKSYHVGIRPVEHSNCSLTSLYIPRSSWHPYTVVRLAGSKEAGDRGIAIYFSHKSALDQKTRNHLENIYWVCFQYQAPRLGKRRKQSGMERDLVPTFMELRNHPPKWGKEHDAPDDKQTKEQDRI